MVNAQLLGMMTTLHRDHLDPTLSPTATTTTTTTTAVSRKPDASFYCSPSTPTRLSARQQDPVVNKTPIQSSLLSRAAPPHHQQSDSLLFTTTASVEPDPTGNTTATATATQEAEQQLLVGNQQPCPNRPSPLAIPELVQEVCSYLDRQTLVRACRISKQFLACSGPLLWADIPERAWTNEYFRSHWRLHASRIRSLCCAPGVDLPTLSLYCHDLVSLDVSRISAGVGVRVKNHQQQRTPQTQQKQQHQQGRGYTRVGCPSSPSLSRLSSCDALVDKQTDSQDLPAQNNRTHNHNSNNSNKTQMNCDRDTYSSFLVMADSLVKVLQANKNLEHLQFKPHGRIPSALLKALAQLHRLRLLSLNGWDDFQEYSLQMILESCSRLSHLSLGENDFTRFTLKSLADTHTSSSSQGALTTGKTEDIVVKLERYDDPIKGGNGSIARYVDQDLLDIHSKRPVLYRSTSASSSSPPSSSGLHMERLPPRLHPLPAYQRQNHHQPTTIPLCSCLQSLSLHQSGLRQDFLENLTRQCPRLEHLSLLDGWGFYPSSRFASILSESCPNLRRLEFREQALDLQDEFFVSLCAQLPGLQCIHAGKTGFSQGALEAVRMSCHSIVSLHLDGARGIQSPALDMLLRTCGSLKVLRAEGVVLNGRDLVKDSRWACRTLEILMVEIEIWAAPLSSQGPEGAEGVQRVREYVYEHLSDLTRLQVLGLGGGHRVGGSFPGVDLTLESGLEKLASLQCLEQLHIRPLFRAIGVEDMAWMVKKWPRLWRLEIGMSPAYTRSRGGDKTNKAVEWLAHSRPGIDIRTR